MTDSVISVQGLVKRYGDQVAVDDVSFEVERGEIFGLLGPNGAGKTTTVECLQGLRHAEGGRLRVLGLDPRTQARDLRRKIGCQLQESALPHRIKVWEANRALATPREELRKARREAVAAAQRKVYATQGPQA